MQCTDNTTITIIITIIISRPHSLYVHLEHVSSTTSSMSRLLVYQHVNQPNQQMNADVLSFNHLGDARIILLCQHCHPPHLLVFQPLHQFLLLSFWCFSQLMTAVHFVLFLLNLGCVLKLTFYLLLLQLLTDTMSTTDLRAEITKCISKHKLSNRIKV